MKTNPIKLGKIVPITSTKSGKTLFDYDVERSLKKCPIKSDLFGKKHIIRKCIPIKNIITTKPDPNGNRISLQPRVDINLPENQAALETSLKMRGWKHDQEPLFVKPHREKSDLFILESGFNRHGAITALGWTHVLVDVYENNPVDPRVLENEILFKYCVNNNNLPSAPNRDKDFVQAAVTAIDENRIYVEGASDDYSYSDEDIASFLKKVVSTQDGTQLRSDTAILQKKKNGDLNRSCLVYKVRRQRGKEKHLRPLDGPGAKKVLKNLGIPMETTVINASGKKKKKSIVFTFPPTNPAVLRTVFWEGILCHIETGRVIDVYGYIESPSYATLNKDRKVIKTMFEDFLKTSEEIVSVCNSGFRENICVRDIFKLKGAIPQDESIVAGKVNETTIVDLSNI